MDAKFLSQSVPPSENSSPNWEDDVRDAVIASDSKVFQDLESRTFLFVHGEGGVPVEATPMSIQQKHPDGSFRTLAMYKCTGEKDAWIPHRLIIVDSEVVWEPIVQVMWSIALTRISCRLAYFRGLQVRKVRATQPGVDVYSVRCHKLLRHKTAAKTPMPPPIRY